MNEVLQLRGSFEGASRKSTGFGAPKLAANKEVSSLKISRLKKDLVTINEDNIDQTLFPDKKFVSIFYNKVVAKSNRTSSLLAKHGSPNDSIIGAKFTNGKNPKHIITHFTSSLAVEDSIQKLETVSQILDENFGGKVTTESFNNFLRKTSEHFVEIDFDLYKISRSNFQKIIVDASYIERFGYEPPSLSNNGRAIITFYDTKEDLPKILYKIGIRSIEKRMLDRLTVLLYEDEINLLLQKAPYLVAMKVEDISKLTPISSRNTIKKQRFMKSAPKLEPTIGVIDTLFDESVYFNEWVDYHNLLDDDQGYNEEDKNHGTEVTSIIVDGPSLNPDFEDNCGNFKVRHFGVMGGGQFSSFNIIKKIKQIIQENQDIKVWNLSLGSIEEVNRNFISAEGAVLDQIQSENDVIFVIAGTNDPQCTLQRKIGAPADSLNSIVVNSVDENNNKAKYSRKGIVLSFFAKPDISYYGGTPEKPMKAWSRSSLGEANVHGTSYAAPWIARKLAFLINKMGLSKEAAKALLIDSALGWKNNIEPESIEYKGYGVVPINIDHILSSNNEEIRFIVEGQTDKYDTHNYSLPVPISDGKYPYIAKATMCYFPSCSRNQGVDYTNTEFDIQFGRVVNSKGKIATINNNQQSVEGEYHPIFEEEARAQFRKWDNTKHIVEIFKPNARGKKVYPDKMWGLSIKKKERNTQFTGEGVRFGVVITLREINGVNRIEEFIQRCGLSGWLVNRLNIEERQEIYMAAETEIEFD